MSFQLNSINSIINDEEQQQPLKKRRVKVSLACELCRDRKVRCDGLQPACTRCTSKNLECIYSRRPAKAKVSSDYVEALEQRLNMLEGSKNLMPMDEATNNIQTTNDSNGTSNPSSEAKVLPEVGRGASPTFLKDRTPQYLPALPGAQTFFQDRERSTGFHGEIYKNAVLSPASSISSSTADKVANKTLYEDTPSQVKISPTTEEGMEPPKTKVTTDAMGAINIKPGASTEDFYGSSSALSFMRLVEAAAASSESSSDGEGLKRSQPSSIKLYKMSGNSSAPSYLRNNQDNWVLPPRRLADHYVSCYFTYAYSLYPFLHQPSFMETYSSIWSGSGETNEDTLFYCILNVVFAFGCLLSPRLETPHKEATAQTYFERSKELLDFDLLDTGSLMLLQALLLTGQYLQATNNPGRCWNVVGLAIRVAQGLGIHRKQNVAARPSFIEQEVCRRVWYGCVLMDRVVGMTFGRPLMIVQNFQVELPLFVDDIYITDQGVAEERGDEPSIMTFFGETIKLYDILADILKDFYDIQEQEVISDNRTPVCEKRTLVLNNIMKLETRLDRFKSELPNHLRVDNLMQELGGATPFKRQANTLQARYLHVRIMLYRPVLLPHMLGYKVKQPINGLDGHLRSSVEQTVSKLCVMAAIELINLIYDNKDTLNIPAWWYCIFYIYTSATVLLAAKLRPNLETSLENQPMDLAWKRAIQLLRQFEPHGASSTRCLQILEVLHEKISSASQSKSKTLFDFLPNLVDSNTDFGSESEFLFSMINDQVAPFADNSNVDNIFKSTPGFFE